MSFLVRTLLVLSICPFGSVALAGQGLADRSDEARAAFAQADSATTKKSRVWTGERLAAAKKRWARNKEKFSACSNELAEQNKVKKTSLHAQGDFLEACMRRP
jgi:hypothetical protein